MNAMYRISAALALIVALATPATAQEKVTIYSAAPQDLLDHVIIAYDALGKLRAKGVVVADELFGGLGVGERGHACHDETGSYETVREPALYLWTPVKAGRLEEWHRACCAGRSESRFGRR